MIYDNNRKNPELDRALFENPTAEYRGTPFWAWNCDLDKDELLRQIDIFKEMGLGGFHMHCRDGMSTTYLSEDFMDLVKACTDHAEKNQMLAWLYDEDRWPSGFAGGYVTKDDTFRKRYIVFSCKPDYPVRDNTVIIAAFDVVLDSKKCLASYRKVGEGDAVEGVRWTVYREIAPDSSRFNHQAYVDTLNPRAIEKFIEITHEAYARAVGDRFGTTVPAIFTDEPQFERKGTLNFADSQKEVKLPWTDDLEESFTAAYGESLVDHLPELLWDLPEDKPSLIRYRYHDHVAERFAAAFADTCGAWCEAHNLPLTGHMMNEHTLESQTASLGDCMRSYRSFGIPGIDMLMARFEFSTAKQCQSAVHQYGRPGMMSELYGVTGWDFDFRGHKLHGDWQAALGVTVRVQHLSWVSMKGMAKRDYPASISYQSPWYKEYSYVEDHFARVNTALTRGKPLVKVAMIHPIESYWLHFGPNEQTALARDTLNDNFMNVTEWLLRGNIDFDYIAESLLPSQCPTAGAPLKVGEMAYDVIIVPECETLRGTTLERLEAFRNAGGKLIFMGSAPRYEDAQPSERGRKLYERSLNVSFNRGAILDALKEDRTVEIRNMGGSLTTNLIHQVRRDEKGLWLFISHCAEPYNKDVAKKQGIRIHVKGMYTPELWDTQTGEIKPIRHHYVNGETHIFTNIYDYDSLLLFLRDTDEATRYAPEEETALEPVATAPMTVPYTLSEPNVVVLDMPRFALDDGEWEGPEEVRRLDAKLRRRLGFRAADAQPWVIENTPPVHTVSMEFTIHSDIDYDEPMLALEDADIVEITFNGQPIVYKDAGYYTDRSIRKIVLPKLHKGENILTVKQPFGERIFCENMYLLGQFGVQVHGRLLKVTELPEQLGFSDLTMQGLPFYGGVVSYHIPVSCREDIEEAIVAIPHYTAAVNTVEVDGVKKATIAYPPYSHGVGKLSAGEHTVTVNCFISRRNCFGDIHNADEKYGWQGPRAWTTAESEWTYEYRLRRTGVISAPQIYKK